MSLFFSCTTSGSELLVCWRAQSSDEIRIWLSGDASDDNLALCETCPMILLPLHGHIFMALSFRIKSNCRALAATMRAFSSSSRSKRTWPGGKLRRLIINPKGLCETSLELKVSKKTALAYDESEDHEYA